MILDDSTNEDLKLYLIQELTRISDADPGMLAEYIIALLKHDKDNAELKSLCITQLEDFLQQDTEPFVTAMFKALESKSYIRGKSTAAPTSSSAAPPPAAASSSAAATIDNLDDEYIPTGPAADRNSSSSRGHTEKHHRGDSDASEDEDRSYKHARRDDDRDSDRRRRDYSPSRPSEEDRFGPKRVRPNDTGNFNGQSDFDRRGDRGMRQQGLTTAGFNSRNNNSSNFNGINNQPGFHNNGPNWNGPQQHRNNFENGPRNNFQDQNQGSWRGGSNVRGGRGGMQGGPGFGQERQRRQKCRDYEEKGYCMRGDMCPYDHGEDRIVVDDAPGAVYNMMGMQGGPMGPNGMGAHRPPFFPDGPNNGHMPGQSDVYDPEATSLSGNGMGGARQGNDAFQQGGAEGGRFNPETSGRGGMRGRGSLRGMRGGRGRGGGSHPYAAAGRFAGSSGSAGSKTSLVVEHIPDEFNTIDKVNEFFKQFGSLTNIQVDQGAHKALIQYSSRDEANAAYNSPEVIFGNRFVKVYWQPEDLDTATFGRQPKPSGQVRPEMGMGGGAHGHHSAPKPPMTSVLMTPERATELAAERAAAAAKMEENKKTMLEIQRQREALIQRQQEEQKLLLQKMFANKNMSQEDKDEILKGLKAVAIEVTKEPVDPLEKARAAATAAEIQRQAEAQKEAERREKERLDRELEVLNANPVDATATAGAAATGESSGATAAETTASLKARLAALQAQAASLGLENQGGYAGRGGRGGYVPRGRGRGAANTWTRGGGSHNRTFRIDNRSTKLSIGNIDEASQAGLKEHFESFGEIESFHLGPDSSSATVQYKNRTDAEKAMQHGSQAPNAAAPLRLGWISEPQAPTPTTYTPSALKPMSASAGTSTELPSATVATAGVAGYESEDEDGERSWKR